MSLLAVAVPGVGATSQVTDAEEQADASDFCYIWIDGNTYCCEFDGSNWRCEVPHESAEAESVSPADDVPREQTDASDFCYIWIDGKVYCCEQTSTGLRCEVPPAPKQAASVAPAAEVSTASNGCVGDKDLAAVCVCTQSFEPLFEVWVDGNKVAEGPICY